MAPELVLGCRACSCQSPAAHGRFLPKAVEVNYLVALQSQQHTNLTIPQLSAGQVLLCFRAGFAGEGRAAPLALLTSTDSRNVHRSHLSPGSSRAATGPDSHPLLSLAPPAHRGEAQTEPELQGCSGISSAMAFPAGGTAQRPTQPSTHATLVR